MADKLSSFKVSQVTKKFDVAQDRIREKLFKVALNQTTLDFNDRFNILEQIIGYGRDICSAAFGDLGQRLYDVSQELDMDHPDIESGKFLATFTEDEEAPIKIVQLLKLYTLAKEYSLNSLDGLFSKCATKSLFPSIKSSINILKNRQQFVRLFSDATERGRLRSLKQVRSVAMTPYMKKIGTMWDGVPDLTHYERFGDFHKQQLAIICARAEVFKQMGLPALQSVMQEDIDAMGVESDYKYYGFQRIPITVAAIVLGKMHDCKFQDNRIIMPASNFTGYDFEAGHPVHVTSVDGELKAVQREISDFVYDPMAYPLGQCSSPKMQKVVEYLDHFPEANRKPIFDHFVMVVPSISLPAYCQNNTLGQAHFHLYDTTGKKLEFHNLTDARMALDTILIKERYVVPALLGEKDAKFYFICFWE